MFSTAARRAAPAHPESPRRDKKPRPEPLAVEEDVQLREKTPNAERADRLSASDFYTVTEDVTPQPFKGETKSDVALKVCLKISEAASYLGTKVQMRNSS